MEICDILGYDEGRYRALESAGIVVDRPTRVRTPPELDMDERVQLGRLAYWDRDYKKGPGID